jgi:hypothetical protein
MLRKEKIKMTEITLPIIPVVGLIVCSVVVILLNFVITRQNHKLISELRLAKIVINERGKEIKRLNIDK